MENNNSFERTQPEIYAISILDKYLSEMTEEKMIKKLSEEVTELAMGIAQKDEENIEEELGDCLLILLHIKSKRKRNASILNLITETAQKVNLRFETGYYDKNKNSEIHNG